MNKISLNNSSKDHLIEQIIKDPLYKIKKDGTIWTKLTLNGQGIDDEWRQMGYEKADGYVRVRYRDDFLFVHRVIFWKFKGPIELGHTIDHKDQDRSNNHPENLYAKTQGDNNKNKSKKYKKKTAYIIKKVIAKLKGL
jgi:hypothetical protein